jgi:hypothetical protein
VEIRKITFLLFGAWFIGRASTDKPVNFHNEIFHVADGRFQQGYCCSKILGFTKGEKNS